MTFGSPLADVSGGNLQFAQRRINDNTHEVGVGDGGGGDGSGNNLARVRPMTTPMRLVCCWSSSSMLYLNKYDIGSGWH